MPASGPEMSIATELGTIGGLVGSITEDRTPLERRLDVLGTRLDVAYDEFGLDIYPDDPGVSIVPGSIKFDGNTVHLSLTANPSHLEIVNPVVEGKARARQRRRRCRRAWRRG